MSANCQLSVVIPVVDRVDELPDLIAGYERALQSIGLSNEMIFVVDGGASQSFEALKELKTSGSDFKIIRLAKYFGEATALSVGFSHASGELLLTLPSYHQIDPESLPRLVDAMADCDMAIARRSPRSGSWFESLRRNAFHLLLRSLSGERYHDLGCGVRLFDRRLASEINLYGDQHRFFPVLASRQGFRVAEVDVQQSEKDRFRGRYRIRDYLHRVLDIVTVFFLVRFTKKPLRFFGMIGSIVSAFGAVVVSTVVVQRLFYDMALAERPALLLGALLLVVGIQVFALGLIGELIIFTHASKIDEYTVDEIVN